MYLRFLKFNLPSHDTKKYTSKRLSLSTKQLVNKSTSELE